MTIPQPRTIDRQRDDIALFIFNCQPSRYLHPSWRDEFVAPALSTLLFQGRFGHARLSAFILQKMGIAAQWCTDARHPATQVGLYMDAPRMHRLACRLALGHPVVGTQIRGAIGRQSAAAWRDAIGLELYHYACQQAPLTGGTHLWDGPAWRIAPSDVDTASIHDLLPSLGYRFLMAGTRLLPPALAQRLRLKLPYGPLVAGSLPDLTACTAATDAIDPALTLSNTYDQEVWTWINRIGHALRKPVSPFVTRATDNRTSIAPRVS